MRYILFAALLYLPPLLGECRGRIDIGPAWANIDMLESGKTKRTLNLPAVKGDMSLFIYEGLCIKPAFLAAWGKAKLNSASVGLGYCIPFCETISITPSIGITETRYKSRIHFPHFGMFHLRERFVSQGVYFGLEGAWTFFEKWRVYGIFQYIWSRVHTKVRPLFNSRDHTKGPSYAAVLERDLCQFLSIILAAGYNISLSKEKHGLRGKGVKLGLAYWY